MYLDHEATVLMVYCWIALQTALSLVYCSSAFALEYIGSEYRFPFSDMEHWTTVKWEPGEPHCYLLKKLALNYETFFLRSFAQIQYDKLDMQIGRGTMYQIIQCQESLNILS